MNCRTLSMILMAGLVAVGACGDVNAPADVAPAFAKGGNGVAKGKKHTSTDTTTSSTTDPLSYDDAFGTGGTNAVPGSEVPPYTIVQSADAPPLTTYSTSFTAIQGEGNTFVVFYDNPWTPEVDQSEWFMKLDVPSDAVFVDANGNPVPYGEPVNITVEIDKTRFFVQFGPHGSVFVGKKPALLKFNLAFAELSGGDPGLLDIWYQPSAGDTWTPEPTEVDQRGMQALVDIYHFSNYAIAW